MCDAEFAKREKAALDELFSPMEQRWWISMASQTERYELVINWESITPASGIEPVMKVLKTVGQVRRVLSTHRKSELPTKDD
ncbi:MAG: hypothetical protein IT365_29480 [Candidatus Hydrogenedentes bacterium]|nr:hypothetical protein [Candidatus Hydrogenedentota bacterium]